MLEILRRSWAFVSLLLIFILLASLVFWPALARLLGLAILGLSLGAAVLFTFQRHWQHRQAGGGKPFVRSLALDLLGLGFALAAYARGFGRGWWPGSRSASWRPGEYGLHGSV